jgi:hypothetical protein
MTIKEKDGYYKNGAFYPYKETLLIMNKATAEVTDEVTIRRFPGPFKMEAKMSLTGDEFDDMWSKLGCVEGLEIREVSKKKH